MFKRVMLTYMPAFSAANDASLSNSELSPLKLLPVSFWYAERSLLICITLKRRSAGLLGGLRHECCSDLNVIRPSAHWTVLQVGDLKALCNPNGPKLGATYTP